MKNIKILILLSIILTGLILPVFSFIEPVRAAGNTTVTINASAVGGYGFLVANNQVWENYRTIDADSTGNWIGWEFRTDNGNHVMPYSSTYRWDISSIPADAEIVSAYVINMPSTKYDTYNNYSDFYMTYRKSDWGADSTRQNTDNGNWISYKNQGYQMLTAPFRYSECTTGVAKSMELLNTAEALERYAATDYVFMDFFTVNLFSWGSPIYTGEANGNRLRMDITQSAGGYPKLQITYVTTATARTEDLHVNAAVDTETTGAEVANNVTLETLKCMYADETLSFLVNGESGANVTLELLDVNGAVLDDHNDSIRTDGIYSWQMLLASSYSGFVRVHETNFDLYSQWISVQPSPSSTESTNKVYAGSTVYPQYTYPFSQYVVFDNGLMYVHWKTNLDPSSELPDYTLQLLSNGVTSVYEHSLEDMKTYYDGTVTNQENLLHWRYAVFTPSFSGEGSNDYSGIVQDLHFNESLSLRTGFVQAHIVETADTSVELAETHTAYWYLTSAEKGLTIALESSSYANDKTPVVNLTVGSECKVETMLSTGNIEALTNTNFTAELGTQRLVLPVISALGARTVTFTLSGAGHTYVYRYDMTLTITDADDTTGTKVGEIDDPNNILGLIKKILGFIHADTPGEKWIWLMVGMGLLVGVFWFSSVMRVVMPMCLFGAACVSGWIDPWWVILLALGAGVYIYSAFKKKSGESGG